jgi:alkylation response protein AidB-like acyl-CoA dehydrogenase
MFWSEYARDLGEWVMTMRGARSMVRPDGEHYALDRWQSEFLQSRSGTIWGGTAQVQRNIVGERVLGLPKEPGSEQ